MQSDEMARAKRTVTRRLFCCAFLIIALTFLAVANLTFYYYGAPTKVTPPHPEYFDADRGSSSERGGWVWVGETETRDYSHLPLWVKFGCGPIPIILGVGLLFGTLKD